MKIASKRLVNIEPHELEFTGKAEDIFDEVANNGFLSMFDMLIEKHFHKKTPTFEEVNTWVAKNEKMIIAECCDF